MKVSFILPLTVLAALLSVGCKGDKELGTDLDDDGVEDADDNCPDVANEDQADEDEDGVGDACDDDVRTDSDGDGIIDADDNCPDIANEDQVDVDKDGIGDACDDEVFVDGDGDGVGDGDDNCPALANADQADLDEDGVGDACDDDVDGDGALNGADNCELLANSEQADLDEDGMGDVCDDDIDGDGLLNGADNCAELVNLEQADLDEDGIGDVCDADIDGDTVLNGDDNCAEVANTDQADLDEDDFGDLCDDDIDGDGVLNDEDNCPSVGSESQADQDEDGVGDDCDDDIDGDGVLNGDDNCALLSNQDQADLDEDGTGDVCDDDVDGDGTVNEDDNCELVANGGQEDQDEDGTGDACDDSDGDGVFDDVDACEGDDATGDLDGDGLCDDLDQTCELAGGEAFAVDVDESCLIADIEIIDPWNVAVESQFSVGGLDSDTFGVAMSPVVINLTDDNGDGVIDDRDSPDVVVIEIGVDFFSGRVTAFHGDGSGVIFRTDPAVVNVNGFGGLIAVDLEADGVPELVMSTTDSRVLVLTNEGDEKWRSAAALTGFQPFNQPAAGDLDGDGYADLVVDRMVVDGRDGSVRFELPLGYSYSAAIIANIDNVGLPEIIASNTVYNADGTLRWADAADGFWAAPVNVDGDDEAELFLVGASGFRLFEHDGTPIFSTPLPPVQFAAILQPGPSCAADFDGDGAIEFAVSTTEEMVMIDTDGTIVWSMPVSDPSGLAGCSAYDVNGDGVFEILFADENVFWIFDGATGAVNFQESAHGSGTIFEYPVVADIDKDGSAEILVASNDLDGLGVLRGVTVFGHAGDGWAAAGSTWPVHDFAVTNISPTGILAGPDATPPWLADNVYRGRPTVDTGSSDLSVAISESCEASCLGGEVALSVEVSNTGRADVPPGAIVALYAVDEAGVEVELTRAELPAVPAGTALATVALSTTLDQVGVAGLLVRVDADGQFTECDESNNDVSWATLSCLPE